MQNVYQVFLSDPVLHGAIGYNILTGRIDIYKPLWWERNASAMSDTDFNYLMLYLEKQYGLNNENRIRRALTVVSCLISNPLPYQFPGKALFRRAFSSLETKATKKFKKNQNSKGNCRKEESGS